MTLINWTELDLKIIAYLDRPVRPTCQALSTVAISDTAKVACRADDTDSWCQHLRVVHSQSVNAASRTKPQSLDTKCAIAHVVLDQGNISSSFKIVWIDRFFFYML